MEKLMWGIDPGSSICGVCGLISGRIGYAFNIEPTKVYSEILRLSNGSQFIVVIEDILPYSLQLTPAVIDTCKVIGDLTGRFSRNDQATSVHLVARNSVKKWIFESYPDLCSKRIENKILSRHGTNLRAGKRGFMNQDGQMRKPSFNWVDDKIVVSAMRKLFEIPLHKPGKPNIYGLKDHSWQSLALIAYFAHTANKSSEQQ